MIRATVIPRRTGITGAAIFRLVNSGEGIRTSLRRGEPQHVQPLPHTRQMQVMEFPLWRPKHLPPKGASPF